MKKESITPEEKERNAKKRMKASAILNTVTAVLFALTSVMHFIDTDKSDNLFGYLYAVLTLLYAFLAVKAFREIEQ